MLSAIAALAYVNISYVPDHLKPAKIIGLPADYDPRAIYQPYTGPHPSAITRPTETFTFPIPLGETGPVKLLFGGPLTYPFLCRSEEIGMGQPDIDNHDGAGIKVYRETSDGTKTTEVIGYSKDCSLKTRAWYVYKRKGSKNFYPIEEASDDIETINVNGKPVDYIVRVETGTINRHPYILAVIKGEHETLSRPNTSNWNRRLVYYFRGGVGIGKYQGKLSVDRILNDREQQLAKGYAVIHSTANQTSNHYNIWLAEDTALRVKRQFVTLYAEPEYTVGIGRSGGAIQQYLLAQNNPDIIDAAIPLYSYPDMISQTIHILDCELLEFFFDVIDADNQKWHNWSNRSLIEGLNAKDEMKNAFDWATALSQVFAGQWPSFPSGNTECVKAWRGLTPLIINPKYSALSDRVDAEIRRQTHFNYWDDLKHFYGTDDNGYARITWDNVGVQYGLQALKQGDISTETFLKLNASIGGWKHTAKMEREYFWYLTDEWLPSNISVWSHHNANNGWNHGAIPAKRTQGDIPAMQAAYQSGQVFLGKLKIPTIDLRHYLDEELDMHHSFASFSVRSRMLREQGHADNQIIWMTHKPHIPINDALEMIDRWMANIKNNRHKSVAENRPADAQDKCFDVQGKLIAEGENVWDGLWNGKKTGACLKVYPNYRTSRMVAGNDIAGDVFKCALQNVQQALDSQLYAPVNLKPYQTRLEQIFPQGVCDYSQAGIGRPDNIGNI